MIIEYISASRLTTFIDCPFKYFLAYHLKLPELRKDTIHTTKGTAAHLALERHVKKEGEPEATLKQYYAENKPWYLDDRREGKGFPHPVEKNCSSCKWASHVGGETICTIAARDIKDFDGCPKPNFEDDLKLVWATINRDDSPLERKILGVELPFDMELDGFKVHGFIDLVTEVDEETIEVIDYKTGNRPKTVDDAFKDVQMRIYSMVIKTLFPQYKYVMMTLDFLRHKTVTVTFGPEDDKKTRDFLRDSYKKITNSIDPPRNKSFKCSWCIGFDNCTKIRNTHIDNKGDFKMPPPTVVEKKPVDPE